VVAQKVTKQEKQGDGMLNRQFGCLVFLGVLLLWQLGAAAATIEYELPGDANVSMVIEDAQGARVRNLLASVARKAGKNTEEWDGRNDRGAVLPEGTYRVRGLYHKGLDALYQFHYYNAGVVPWHTGKPDEATKAYGGWGADHNGNSYVATHPAGKDPRIFLANWGTEIGHFIFPVDGKGRKLGVSGTWDGAQIIAVDGATPREGSDVTDIYCANDAAGFPGKGEWTLRRFGWGRTARTYEKADLLTAAYPLQKGDLNVSGLAAWDGKVCVALRLQNEIRVYAAPAPADKAAKTELVKTIKADSPRGLAFDRNGALFAATGKGVVRVNLETGELAPVVTEGLEQPFRLAVDAKGRIYVSDYGPELLDYSPRMDSDWKPNQEMRVKMYSPDGKLIRAFGKPGGRNPAGGPYDPEEMCCPRGIAVDSEGQLWVAEDNYELKRYTVWETETGKFVRELLGPPIYGAAGAMDPDDPSRVFYYQVEFKHDAESGETKPVYVHNRALVSWIPESISTHQIIRCKGREYMVACNGENPRLFLKDEKGQYRYVACVGNGGNGQFQGFLQSVMKLTPPQGDWEPRVWGRAAWSDANGDEQKQPEEISHVWNTSDQGQQLCWLSGYVASNLTWYWIGGNEYRTVIWRISPQRFDDRGVPYYDVSKAEELIPDFPGGYYTNVRIEWVDGEGRIYVIGTDIVSRITPGTDPAKWAYQTSDQKWHARWGKGPYDKLDWWYPLRSQEHGQFELNQPAGSLIHLWKFSGAAEGPKDLGPFFGTVTAGGERQFMTADGIYIGGVFRNPVRDRVGSANLAVGGGGGGSAIARDTSLNGLWTGGEQWSDTFVGSKDGNYYLMTGPGAGVAGVTVVKVTGFENVRRLPPSEVNLKR